MVWDLPKINVDHGGVIKNIKNRRDDAKDQNAADILVEDTAEVGGGMPNQESTDGDETQDPGDIFDAGALGHVVCEYTKPFGRLTEQISGKNSRQGGGKFTPENQYQKQNGRQMGNKRIYIPNGLFREQKQQRQLQSAAQQAEDQRIEAVFAGQRDTGKGCTEKNAEYQNHCTVKKEQNRI